MQFGQIVIQIDSCQQIIERYVVIIFLKFPTRELSLVAQRVENTGKTFNLIGLQGTVRLP